MTDCLQIVATVERREDAERIARALVEERLAACAQISGPIESTYHWRGKIETAQEWRCTVKTRRDLYEAVERAIRSLHPYEVPEIVAIPIEAGLPDYLAWIEAETYSSRSARGIKN